MLPPSFGLALLLTTLVALEPLSTDLYLPALPGMTAEFATDVARVQLTLSVFLIGFAVAQLFYGPLSDRFGRRPVLLAGLALFMLGSIASMLAPSIEWLVAARLLQGFGACSGAVAIGFGHTTSNSPFCHWLTEPGVPTFSLPTNRILPMIEACSVPAT